MAPMLMRLNNDPYIPLAPTSTSAPTTVKMTGVGFLPGAKVVAIVNGEEHELETAFVNSWELSATVPASVFGVHAFTAQITTTIADGTNTAAPATLLAKSELITQEQVTFQAETGNHNIIVNDKPYLLSGLKAGYGIHYKKGQREERHSVMEIQTHIEVDRRNWTGR